MKNIGFKVNNGGQLTLEQVKNDKEVKVTCAYDGITEKEYTISSGDFVMLLNLYQHIKNNDIHNDFINPYGKN